MTDPLAAKHGVTHKCLIDMDGRPMIEHVLLSLAGASHVDSILVSIEDAAVLNDISMMQDGSLGKPVTVVESRETLFDSVASAFRSEAHFPAIICTADNALQTAEMVDHFCAGFVESGCDAAVALTEAEVIWAKYPEGQRRPYVFRDGKYSNCNLFGLRTPRSVHSAQAFRGGGQFGKSKARIFKAFGLINLLKYQFKLVSVDGVFRGLSKRFGVKIIPVIMPFAEAPIDVDNERTERIALSILRERKRAGAPQ